MYIQLHLSFGSVRGAGARTEWVAGARTEGGGGAGTEGGGGERKEGGGGEREDEGGGGREGRLRRSTGDTNKTIHLYMQ